MFIRSQERMVAQSVGEYVFSQLAVLGWFSAPSSLPFGATAPVTLLDHVPAAQAPLEPNSLAFTEGPETEEEGELGCASGGLWLSTQVFFLDVYGENQGIAKSLMGDLKAMLNGKLPGATRYIAMKDYSQTPAVAADGHVIHFENIVAETPPNQQYQRDWRVLKFEAIHEFNASEGVSSSLFPGSGLFPGSSLLPIGS